MGIRLFSNDCGQVVVLNDCLIDSSKRGAVEAIVRSYFGPDEQVLIEYRESATPNPILRLPLGEFGSIENPTCRHPHPENRQSFVGEFKLMDEEIRKELE